MLEQDTGALFVLVLFEAQKTILPAKIVTFGIT